MASSGVGDGCFVVTAAFVVVVFGVVIYNISLHPTWRSLGDVIVFKVRLSSHIFSHLFIHFVWHFIPMQEREGSFVQNCFGPFDL